MYREGQKWRREAIAELKRRPEWIEQWLADRELDRRIEELCEAKGLRFAPHECPPLGTRRRGADAGEVRSRMGCKPTAGDTAAAAARS
jgi:hypothetical protein